LNPPTDMDITVQRLFIVHHLLITASNNQHCNWKRLWVRLHIKCYRRLSLTMVLQIVLRDYQRAIICSKLRIAIVVRIKIVCRVTTCGDCVLALQDSYLFRADNGAASFTVSNSTGYAAALTVGTGAQ
jgi:hypothetical protein